MWCVLGARPGDVTAGMEPALEQIAMLSEREALLGISRATIALMCLRSKRLSLVLDAHAHGLAVRDVNDARIKT